jgi:hypothetical protein
VYYYTKKRKKFNQYYITHKYTHTHTHGHGHEYEYAHTLRMVTFELYHTHTSYKGKCVLYDSDNAHDFIAKSQTTTIQNKEKPDLLDWLAFEQIWIRLAMIAIDSINVLVYSYT